MVSDEGPPPDLVSGDGSQPPEKTGRLNFYRVHNLFFTFTPLCLSIIFYVCNGRYKISYIDSLFSCLSAMTVCGLVTIDLSSLTGFQQALLFIQMCIGNPIIISWVMVVIRKYYFAQKFQHVLQNAGVVEAAEPDVEPGSHFHRKRGHPVGESATVHKRGTCLPLRSRKLRADMVRRLDDEPKPVNPSGWVPDEGFLPVREVNSPILQVSQQRTLSKDNSDFAKSAKQGRRLVSEPINLPTGPSSFSEAEPQRFATMIHEQILPRTQTIEFAAMPEIQERSHFGQDNGPAHQEGELVSSQLGSSRGRRASMGSYSPRVKATQTNLGDIDSDDKDRGFGGFPTPWNILSRLLVYLSPARLKEKIGRTMTIPATITPSQGNVRPGTKQVPYIKFEAFVGRNSAFRQLTKDQRDELGGIEYRALNALLWIIPVYSISCLLVSFIMIAPYISQPRWQQIFRNEQQRPINSVWFAVFQVVSAYTNTGMSLVDQSMIPFQEAVLMVIVMIFLILAGNTAFPVFLRFTIWCSTKVLKSHSRLNETLRFLLDHPRRCFMYLFPSQQTWFLFSIVLGLNFVDWFFLLILDIGNSAIEEIPLGARILDGLMQAVSVKAAGFAIIPLATLAPAVKVLFVMMMYIGVYPIAMSVRSTNVYEEQSLGIFHEEEPNNSKEPTFDAESAPRLSVLSQYAVIHVQKQLAFDMWWLAFSLFLICIIEKRKIEDPFSCSWFNIFNIIFELVSAYANVGLSLGMPHQSYSLVGAMRPLSKFIFCVVILRGRHRGLPLAIDRSIMLPSEVEKTEGASSDASGNQSVSTQPANRFSNSRTI